MSAPYLIFSPLISVAVWLAISSYLIRHERYRTWTERFFLAMCACAGGYAASDTVFFSSPVPSPQNPLLLSSANLAASASLAFITVAGFFLYLYGLSLASRFRRVLLVAILPTVFFLVAIPFQMFEGFDIATGPGGLLEPRYNMGWVYPWLLVVGSLWLLGILGVTKTYLEVRQQNPKLANRIAWILAGLSVAVAAGAATNALVAVRVASLPPLFSTFLAIPGLLIFFAVTPSTFRSLNDAFLRRHASEFEVKGAFLTFSDGTLIGSQTAPEEPMIDADSFSATLDVISNFMRTSFPTLRGKWLKSIRHGDYTLLMERGRYAYLTLVISGTENDLLRRTMIEHLEDFEATNGRPLENWRGVATDAVGVDQMLGSLLAIVGGGRSQA